MADFFTPLLLSACIGTSGSYNAACQKALESAYIQSGVSKQVSIFQSGVEKYGKTQEKVVFGKSEWIVNGAVGLGMVVKNKKASVNLPTLGICDKLSTQIETNKMSLNFGWHW